MDNISGYVTPGSRGLLGLLMPSRRLGLATQRYERRWDGF